MGIKISELPLGTANANAIVPATNAAGTLTEKIKLSDIANLNKLHEVGSGDNSIVPVFGNNGAAGEYSAVMSGWHNSAEGVGSFVGGGGRDSWGDSGDAGNSAIGDHSAIVGGLNNTAQGMGSFMGGGASNFAHGNYSIVSGGALNGAYGEYSTVGGGRFNSVNTSSEYGVICGGLDNQIYNLSPFSVLLGGRDNQVSAPFSSVLGGVGSKTSHYGSMAMSGGGFANLGDAQFILAQMRGLTYPGLNTTSLTLNYGPATSVPLFLTIPPSTIWNFSIRLVTLVAAAYTDEHGSNNPDGGTGGVGASWNIRGAIVNDPATGVSLLGSSISESWVNPALGSAGFSVSAAAVNSALDISVTGLDNNQMRWLAVVEIAQLSYGTP